MKIAKSEQKKLREEFKRSTYWNTNPKRKIRRNLNNYQFENIKIHLLEIEISFLKEENLRLQLQNNLWKRIISENGKNI